MKKLTSDEFEQLSIKGKGRSSHLFNSIVNLQSGLGDFCCDISRYIEEKLEVDFQKEAIFPRP